MKVFKRREGEAWEDYYQRYLEHCRECQAEYQDRLNQDREKVFVRPPEHLPEEPETPGPEDGQQAWPQYQEIQEQYHNDLTLYREAFQAYEGSRGERQAREVQRECQRRSGS